MTLLEHDPDAVPAWHGDLPVNSRYTYGPAAERFFTTIRDEGKFYGTRCANCDRTYVPAVLFCERCLGELDEWVDVGTTGEVYTFTFLYEAYDGSKLESPQVIAFIRIGDGGLVHQLGELDEEEVEIGMPVEAVFKPIENREGSMLDIQYFRSV